METQPGWVLNLLLQIFRILVAIVIPTVFKILKSKFGAELRKFLSVSINLNKSLCGEALHPTQRRPRSIHTERLMILSVVIIKDDLTSGIQKSQS